MKVALEHHPVFQGSPYPNILRTLLPRVFCQNTNDQPRPEGRFAAFAARSIHGEAVNLAGIAWGPDAI